MKHHDKTQRTVRELYEAGYSVGVISDRVGVPEPTIWYWRKLGDWKRERKGSQVDAEVEQEARRLAATGMGLYQVAAATGISVPTLYLWRRAGKLPATGKKGKKPVVKL